MAMQSWACLRSYFSCSSIPVPGHEAAQHMVSNQNRFATALVDITAMSVIDDELWPSDRMVELCPVRKPAMAAGSCKAQQA